MSKNARLLFPFCVLVLGACGGGAAQVATHDEHDHDHEHGHERARVAEIDALHDVLAPVFHAEPGATRAAAACENASALHDRSAAVAAAAAPEGVDGSHWHDETSELVSASDALVAECGASGPAAEERLEALHARFHGVMELAYGMEGHEHGEGGHGEGCAHHEDGHGDEHGHGCAHHDGDHHDGDHADGEHHDDDHDDDHH